MLNFILVSQSPERRKILSENGFIFRTSSVSISEKLNKNINLDEAIQRIARQKSEAFLKTKVLKEPKKLLLLSADTLVCIKNKTLGKPQDQKEAFSHMKTLSGSVHSVKTALCFYDGAKNSFISSIDTTFITFKTLTQKEIDNFIKTKDYEKKAGGYSILGPARHFITKKEGSLSNVRGLPLELFQKMVKDNGWHIRKKT